MPFTLSVLVEPADLDEVGHANNVVYLRWVQHAAVAHSSAVGFDMAAYRALGAIFIVVRHEIDYLRPALLGDALAVETRVVKLGSASSERHTTIRHATDGTLLARAATRWAYVELARNRPARIPAAIRSAFPVDERLTD